MAAALIGGGVVALLVALFVLAAGSALLSSYTSALIPASCTGAVSQLPPDRDATVPGVGVGTMLAADADTEVVVVADYRQNPAASVVYIVNTRDNKVVQTFGLRSDAVVAAISDGVLYLFDDKIGYITDASTGQPVQKLVEIDNYRGLFTSGAERHLQTDAEISLVASSGSVFSHRHLDFEGIAYGCLITTRA